MSEEQGRKRCFSDVFYWGMLNSGCTVFFLKKQIKGAKDIDNKKEFQNTETDRLPNGQLMGTHGFVKGNGGNASAHANAP